MEGNYNEYGEIYIQPDFEFSNWRKGNEYTKLARKASAGQLFMLFLSMTIACGLSAYALYLHKKLIYRKPWIPPARFSIGRVDDGDKTLAARISRENSGIGAMRSRSYESAASSRPYVAYSGSIPHRRNGTAGSPTVSLNSSAGSAVREQSSSGGAWA